MYLACSWADPSGSRIMVFGPVQPTQGNSGVRHCHTPIFGIVFCISDDWVGVGLLSR